VLPSDGLHVFFVRFEYHFGGGGQNRTADLRVMSPSL
jgi:hypothetical protein